MKTFLTCIFTVIFFSYGYAQDGSLDPSFGDNGIVHIDVGATNERAYAMTKVGNQLLLAGYADGANNEHISIRGFNLDGSINTNFGSGGIKIIEIGTGDSQISSMVVQPDGKIILAGWVREGSKDEYLVARIADNGDLDNGFGTGGIVKGSFSNSSFAEDEVQDVGLLSDGKIVITGRSYNGQNDDAFVGCFNSDGSLYANFGSSGGYSIIDFGNDSPSEDANALVIDAQDNIYLGGQYSVGFQAEDGFFIQKMNAEGVVDNSFGNNGNVFYTINDDVVAGLNSLALDAQGRILTGGGAFNTNELDNNFFVTRFSANGQIDTGFGDNGRVILPGNSNESIFDLTARAEGDIIAAGSTGGFASRFAVARLSETGLLDTNFGSNGWATTMISSTFNGIASMYVDEDCIYGAGFAYNGDFYHTAMAKYRNAGMASSLAALDPGITNLGVFPNPIETAFQLNLLLSENKTLSVQLLDLSGRRIAQLLTDRSFAQGEHALSFDRPAGLISGAYLLELRSAEGVVVEPLIFR